MAVSAFCYSLTIPNGVETIGLSLRYLPYNGNQITVNLSMLDVLAQTNSESTTYFFCSRTYPQLLDFNNQTSFEFYGMTVDGGTNPCTSNSDCLVDQGGGGGSTEYYCYQIAIDSLQIGINSVEFEYTAIGSSNTTTITLASNWLHRQTNGAITTLYVCSSTLPIIYLYGDPFFDPSAYGVTVTGGNSICTDDTSCLPALPPVNCTLSSWGYGATQQSWTAGVWGPCTLVNGSYQQVQTRYVITPASNGGTCVGETIRYQSCTPPVTGTVATLTTPTFSSTTSTSTTATTTISNSGGSTVTRVAFKLFQNGVQVNQQTLTDFSLGISATFTGLLANTAYTVVATATNSTGNGDSPTGSVTTSGAGGLSTPTISAITQTSATSTSTFTNTGGEVYARYGLIYKLGNSSELFVNSPGVIKVQSGALAPNQTSLVSQLSGLTPNLQYYVKSYVESPDGLAYLYSSAANFTTTTVQQGINFAALDISSIAVQGSAGNAASYNYITNSPSTRVNRSYVSVIEPSVDDPTPGAYRLTANLQQANLTSIMWTVYTKTAPTEQAWNIFSILTKDNDANLIPVPPLWTYYQYSQDRTTLDFRPQKPGYYNIEVSGTYNDGSRFTVSREIVIGKPTLDINLAYSELRQGTPASIQVSTNIDFPEWIPEFPEDSLYGVSVTQSGSTIIPTITVDNAARSFSSLWAISNNNERISPTLNVNYTSPFKDISKSNSFSKQFTVTVLPPYPVISFSNPSLFTSPVISGGNVTIGVTAQYAKSYVISSTLGTGTSNNSVTYSNVQVGTYTITATAVNDTSPNEQSTAITADLVVQPASPIVAQLPQQLIGRNLYSDINTFSYINLNGSTFNRLAIVTQPSEGTVSVSNYNIRYIPNTDYTGTDLFSFRVNGPGGVTSNIVNVSVLVLAPSFRVGTANETIVFNSTEVNANRDITIPITNSSTTNLMTIHSISLDQDSTDFALRVTSGQTENTVSEITNIELAPLQVYTVKIRATPTAIGVRTAKLKIDHN